MPDHGEKNEVGLKMKEQKPASYYGLIALKWLFRVLGIMSILCIFDLIPKPDSDNLFYLGFVILWAFSEWDWFRKGKRIKEGNK